MKSERLLGWIVLLVCLALGSCSLGKREAKVPLTTSSDEARQLFLKGRDRLDAGQPTEARSYFVQALGQDAAARCSTSASRPPRWRGIEVAGCWRLPGHGCGGGGAGSTKACGGSSCSTGTRSA